MRNPMVGYRTKADIYDGVTPIEKKAVCPIFSVPLLCDIYQITTTNTHE